MRYRTALKTGRTAAMQTDALQDALHAGSFVRYATMVERFSAGYIRPLTLRSPAAKAAA